MTAGQQMRRPLVAGNWKMNTTVEEARTLACAIVAEAGAPGAAEVVLCPPYVSLCAVRECVAGSAVAVGAQNMNAAAKGAYTGEISWTMLQGLCTYVIVGHSERRTIYHETDEDVNAKVRAALEGGLIPIACIGEHLEQRDSGETYDVCGGQVRAILSGVTPDTMRRVVLAYEPLWAIGTGRPATGPIAQEVASHLRGIVRDVYDDTVADGVRILYGGSVTGANAAEFAGQPDVDGALVGGASLKADDFARIVQAFAAGSGQ